MNPMPLYDRFILLALRGYKLVLSPLVGQGCRFQPTCSVYAAEVLLGQGPLRGGWLTARRLCRCHPWGGSGYDPPPPARRNWKCEA